MTIDDIKQNARQTTDEQGQPVIQIPLSVWQTFLDEQNTSQIDQIISLLDSWNPDDTQSVTWWNEFDEFLQSNRLTINERDVE